MTFPYFDVTKIHRQVTKSVENGGAHCRFGATLESSLEAEISVTILPLYLLCIGEKKERVHFGMNSFKQGSHLILEAKSENRRELKHSHVAAPSQNFCGGQVVCIFFTVLTETSFIVMSIILPTTMMKSNRFHLSIK